MWMKGALHLLPLLPFPQLPLLPLPPPPFSPFPFPLLTFPPVLSCRAWSCIVQFVPLMVLYRASRAWCFICVTFCSSVVCYTNRFYPWHVRRRRRNFACMFCYILCVFCYILCVCFAMFRFFCMCIAERLNIFISTIFFLFFYILFFFAKGKTIIYFFVCQILSA